MARTLAFWLAFLVSGAAVAAPGHALTPATLKSLMHWKGKVEIAQQGPVVLVGGEQAILAVAESSEMCHAEQGQLVLYRPAVKQARSLGSAFISFTVRDMDGDQVSDIVVNSGFANTGTFSGGTSIWRIAGWKQQVLAKFTEEESNPGICGEDGGMDIVCESTEVNLDFQDLDQDGKTDVIETVTRTVGEKSPVKSVHRHLFRNGKLQRQ